MEQDHPEVHCRFICRVLTEVPFPEESFPKASSVVFTSSRTEGRFSRLSIYSAEYTNSPASADSAFRAEIADEVSMIGDASMELASPTIMSS